MNTDSWTAEHGDILISRNYKERDNRTPGYWNHAAIIYGPEGTGEIRIIEAQPKPGQVILSDWSLFYHRYSFILLLRHHSNAVRICMAGQAFALVGAPYRWMDTVNRVLRDPFKRGANCLGIIRRGYRDCTGYDPKWRRPDHVVESALRCGFWTTQIKPLPR
jgi:hypothetical protein